MTLLRALLLALVLSSSLVSCSMLDHRLPDSSLQEVYQSDTIWNGVATSANRIFVYYRSRPMGKRSPF